MYLGRGLMVPVICSMTLMLGCAADGENGSEAEIEPVMTSTADREDIMQDKELHQLLQRAESAESAEQEEIAHELLAERESLGSDLRATIDTSATSAASCQVLPIGAKPCGGPRTHLVYSTENSDEAQLARLAMAYTEVDQALVRLTGEMSDCRMEQAPRVVLRDGHCVAIERNSTTRSDR